MKTFRSQLACLLMVLLSNGCSVGAYSPTVDVLGSYFPAWIVCIILGLALTVVTRQILIGLKVSPYLRPAGLVYFCLTVLWTLGAWLVVFNN